MLKQVLSYLKPYCRWIVLGGTLFFVAKALQQHWQEVAAIHIGNTGWATLAIALGITLLAHIWSGWVWTWILRELDQPVNNSQFIQIYLKTNIAKYLPGNVWHFYGRILAAKNAGVAPSAAIISVLLEPLLMAAGALIIVLVGMPSTIINNDVVQLPILGLTIVLITVHPWFLNKAIRTLGSSKLKAQQNSTINPSNFKVKRYPLRPLIGELGFLGLRGSGFLLTILAFKPLELNQLPLLLSAFSFAWLLGLIIPGAPGGLGVFEATAIALLQTSFSPGLIIGAIALYRLISIVAEASGAALAWLDERRLSL